MMRRSLAQGEDVEGDAILACIELGAQDLDAMRGEAAGDVREQAVTVARTDGQFRRGVAMPQPAVREDLRAYLLYQMQVCRGGVWTRDANIALGHQGNV